MKKVFIIDGGAGRVVTSIPAFLKYHKNHPDENWKILVAGWDMMFWNIPELQDRVFNLETKGSFDNYIKLGVHFLQQSNQTILFLPSFEFG